MKYQNIAVMKLQYLFTHPLLNLIAGAICISFSGVWVKIASVPPSSSAFYRVFFGFLFLLVITVRLKERHRISLSLAVLGSITGILFALDLLCWHQSIKYVGPGLATILGNFQVFVLAVVGILILKERYSNLLLISLPLAVVGLFLIVGFSWFRTAGDYRTGIGYGLATAVFYSAYILALKELSVRCSSKIFPMLLASLTTSIALGMYMLINNDPFIIPDLTSFFSLAALGLFSQCLGWLLIATSLSSINTSYAGLILLLQPALSFVWDVLFFARPTDFLNWTGVVVTLMAIYLGVRSKKGPV
ncbi:MAG: DMT family transporter [Desulfopila sp.]|jgi:drug/metabolite transporter (DMT)-like permease|nr:DMT family transporter [Desulfopila sp.]